MWRGAKRYREIASFRQGVFGGGERSAFWVRENTAISSYSHCASPTTHQGLVLLSHSLSTGVGAVDREKKGREWVQSPQISLDAMLGINQPRSLSPFLLYPRNFTHAQILQLPKNQSESCYNIAIKHPQPIYPILIPFILFQPNPSEPAWKCSQ